MIHIGEPLTYSSQTLGICDWLLEPHGWCSALLAQVAFTLVAVMEPIRHWDFQPASVAINSECSFVRIVVKPSHLVVSVAPSKALMHDTIWLKTRWVHRWCHLFVPARWESSFLLFHNSYDFFCSVSDNSNSCSLDELISISGFRFMKNNKTKSKNKRCQNNKQFSSIIFLLGTRGVSRTT